ncbi:MAG: hypothetical protein QUS35_01885 [bacterium]|nr:hypothetical protein [bacterium]
MKSKVTKLSADTYKYSYGVSNNQSSLQKIWNFDIIIHFHPDSILSKYTPTGWWRPFSFDSDSLSWVSWGSPEDSRIKPGCSVDGFGFTTHILPGIVDMYLEGYTPPPSYDGYAEDSPIPGYDDLTPYGPGITGKTIGPAVMTYPLDMINIIDSLINYTQQGARYSWIANQEMEDKYQRHFDSLKILIQNNQFQLSKGMIRTILSDIEADSSNGLNEEMYTILKMNIEFLDSQIGNPADNSLHVRLLDSNNHLLSGGSLMYFNGIWMLANNHGDGSFMVTTDLPKVKLRMTYEHGVEERSNVTVKGNTCLFRTVSASVRLKNSQQAVIDSGMVQYYSGGWFNLGVTFGGIARKELLPCNYKFRMTYEHASNEKYQDIGEDSVVVFQTKPVEVKLINSQSSVMDTGKVQYYAGGWWDFGDTSDGTASKELLPYNYKFRMTYARASNEKYQDVGSNPVVLFQTVPVNVKLMNSQSVLMDTGKVQYYSGGWWDMGPTSGGVAVKELLPYNYKFRMTYAKASNEKYQDVGVNPEVVFQTVNARVNLKDSQGNSMDTGEVKYYSNGWWDLGSTSGGAVSKELLPYNYKFRMTYARASNEKYQDVGSDPDVVFRTVQTRVELRNSQAVLMDGGSVKYYSGGWWDFGSTSNGVVSKELLPYNYKFRMTYANGSNEKVQDTGVNPLVVFPTVSSVVRVLNLQGNPVNNADVKYYSGGWYPFGVTSEGTVARELLPYNYKFRATLGSKTTEKYQDLNVNQVVILTLDVP